jgi:hypothetical protein
MPNRDDTAQAYRMEAARKIQLLVHKQVTQNNPLVSNEDALALVDAFVLAAIKGLEQYLTRPNDRTGSDG